MTPKKKQTFGTVCIDHFSPALGSAVPKGINVYVSFEDALKLHLGLGQILGHLNTYNRNTKEGRESCVNLCVFTDVHSITINEGRLGPRKEAPAPKGLDDLLAEYIAEVEAAVLEPTTKQTYIHHATTFVRWTKGDFTPGSRSR